MKDIKFKLEYKYVRLLGHLSSIVFYIGLFFLKVSDSVMEVSDAIGKACTDKKNRMLIGYASPRDKLVCMIVKKENRNWFYWSAETNSWVDFEYADWWLTSKDYKLPKDGTWIKYPRHVVPNNGLS
jgi:hypothetical protein